MKAQRSTYLLIALLLAACSEEEPSEPLGRVAALQQDQAELMRGEALFLGSCADYCHGMTEESTDNDASFLFDCRWDHGDSDEDIVNVILQGVPGTRMVAFGDNFPDPEDPWRIVAYLRATAGPC